MRLALLTPAALSASAVFAASALLSASAPPSAAAALSAPAALPTAAPLPAGTQETILAQLPGDSPSAVSSGDPRMIGLVELPGLYGIPDPDGPPGSLLPGPRAPIPLYAEPDAASRRLATITDGDALDWREVGYEAPAAVAYGATGKWVQVALREEGALRFGWVPPEHRGTLHRLGDLLEEGLSYLTAHWDGVLREAPSADAPGRMGRPSGQDGQKAQDGQRGQRGQDARNAAEGATELDVNIVEAIERDGVTWLRVQILAPDRCLGVRDPEVVATGWIPALAEDQRPNAWFRSRGC